MAARAPKQDTSLVDTTQDPSKPWCTCKDRLSFKGFVRIKDNIWGHQACMKPTELFWTNAVLSKMYEAELDEIIARLMEGRESEDGLDKGRAEMACKFLAMLITPRNPNMKYVRDEALKRYRIRNPV
jgi:hypothetical protein